MTRISVSLCVFGESLEPEEVSALLGCEPTRSQRKGDVAAGGPGKRVAETGAWFLDCALPGDTDVESQVESILARLTADPDEWDSLTTRHFAGLLCRVEADGEGASFEISPRLAGALAERGLVIEFDTRLVDR